MKLEQMNLKDLLARRTSAWEQMTNLVGLDKKHGGMTEAQHRDYLRAEADVIAISDIVAGNHSLPAASDADKSLHTQLRSIRDAEADPLKRHEQFADVLDAPANEPTVGDPYAPPARAVASDGPLTREQRVSDWMRQHGRVRSDHESLSLGKMLRGYIAGDWSGAENELRALNEGTGAQGGFTVPEPLAGEIIDLARNVGRVFQAGARTVPMTSETLKMARWAGDPSSAWRLEAGVITESDATLERITFKARSLDVLTKASWELLEDSIGVEEELRRAFAEEIALKLDKAALYGSGAAPEPRGIKNTTGVTLQSMGANGAALTNYDPFVDAKGTLADKNHATTGFIHAPRTERSIAKLKDTTNQPLQPPEYVRGVSRFETNQVPVNLTVGTSTDTSDSFAGDWSDLLIGVRTAIQIVPLRERYADTGQVAFIAHLRADVQLAHPESFVVITGIRP